MKILFVCQGNVGRSQMAEGFYNSYTHSNDASSAGVADVGAKYNYHPIPLVIEVMKEEGIDISNHLIKQVTPQMVQEAEEIIVFCEQQECPEFLLSAKDKITFHHIDDPFGSNLEGTRKVRDEIKKYTLSLLSFKN